MNASRMRMPRGERDGGIALVEAAFAVLIVGLMLVAAIQTVGASRLTQLKTADRARAQQLAAGLMAEILSQAYSQPGGGGVFGPESGEAGGTRAYFDDVDDYNGWTASSIEAKDGAVINGFAGWSRSVSVAWVDPADLMATSTVETGVKRVTVTVKKGALVVATLTSVCTDGWVGQSTAEGIVTGNHVPVAVATGTSTAAVGQAIGFDGSGSRDPDGDALSYSWDFGDGSAATGVSVSHSFASAGIYTVMLTVSDGAGHAASDGLTVTVGGSQ